uniref:MFS domain-containing protein n=1 Tax=Globodera pallida TaxID=36090 RepID=A0A183BSU9_GLOPA
MPKINNFLSVSPPALHLGGRLSVLGGTVGAIRPRSSSLRSSRSGAAAASFFMRNGGGSFDEEGRCMICPLREQPAAKVSTASLFPSQRLLPDSNNNSMCPPAVGDGAPSQSRRNSANEVANRYVSYAQRWIVLSAVCLIALSNATQWISFAPLHAENSSVVVVDSCDVELWSSQIFQLVGVLTGLVGMFVTDRFGIRISCHFAAALNLAGAILRVISSIPSLDRHRRLPVLYFGQTVAAMSQPFFLCLSPKVAEHWFGEHQRALANSLSFIANPFGVVLGSIAPVLFVSDAKDSSQIYYLNVSLLALALAVSALTLCVSRAQPPSPPSASSHCEHKPDFARGLQILFRSRIFYIQTLTFGMAFALQWSIFVTADKYFSRLQYPDKLGGYLLSVSAFSGALASVLGGWVVDRTKKFNEFIKAAYVGIAIVGAALNLFLRHPRQSPLDTVVLSVLLTLLGFFAVPVFPISLELGVESTFPVAEATSSGLLIISGQLQLFLLTAISN